MIDSTGVRVEGLTMAFKDQVVLGDFNLEVPRSHIVGVLGPSGSGKTTLIRCAMGLLKPGKGKISIGGTSVPSRSLAMNIGYMAQEDSLYGDLSGGQNLRFFASLYGIRGAAAREAIDRVLALTRLTNDEKKLVRHYSGGMRKRLSLAATLLHKPEFLFLDEPTVGIDPVLRAEFWEEFQRLKTGGTTMVLSTHVMDEAERCDLLALIFEGTLLAYDTPAAIKKAMGADSVEEAFLSLRSHIVKEKTHA